MNTATLTAPAPTGVDQNLVHGKVRQPLQATREIEIRVHIPDGKSELTDVLTLLTKEQLPIVTRSCTADRTGVILLLTTTQPVAVQQAISAAGYRCETHPVILVGPTSARPGAAARLLFELEQQGVNLQYSYLSTIDSNHCYLVCKTADDDQILKVMNAGQNQSGNL